MGNIIVELIVKRFWLDVGEGSGRRQLEQDGEKSVLEIDCLPELSALLLVTS